MSNVTEVNKNEVSMGQRFIEMVNKEVGSSTGGAIALTDHQKRLAQNYFMILDANLGAAEEKRLKRTNNQEPVSYSWNNVNLTALARDVVAAARIGLDPAQPNQIFMIPYKNNRSGKYDIGFLKGYQGLELIATKYALEPPLSITVELVYSKDTFSIHKKSINNPVESYAFEIENPFDRGDIIGGFYAYEYACPSKNKVVVMTIADIEKRKPSKASPEFWGGEKDVWEYGKKVGKEMVDGWYEKMCLKTIKRAAYNGLTIDSQKIDDDYMNLKTAESSFVDSQVQSEIRENANATEINITPDQAMLEEPAHMEMDEPKAVYMDKETGELLDDPGLNTIDLFEK